MNPLEKATHMLHGAYGHPTLRLWHDTSKIQAHNLVYPIFVTDKTDCISEIKAMPEQYQISVDRVVEFLKPIVENGLKSVILFGVITDKTAKGKDNEGSCATGDSSPVPKALELLRKAYPDLLLVVDVCLCAYTSHGHCGIFDSENHMDNDRSIQRLAEIAVHFAKHGAQVIAPSDMMDMRIGAIKEGLAKAGLASRVSVMSYAAKFASCFYGPFREAADSAPSFGNRKNYQLPPNARDLALRAVTRDLQEGADFVMVKPGTPYLDIVRDVKNMSTVPVAIYHVSGEYAMLWHAAAAGAFDLKTAVMENLEGMRRAGADIILTYYTPRVLKWIKEDSNKN